MTLIVEHHELDLPLHSYVSTNKEGALGFVSGYDFSGVLQVRPFRIAANYAVEFGPVWTVPYGTPGNTDYDVSLYGTANLWVYPDVAILPIYFVSDDSWLTVVIKVEDDLSLSYQGEAEWDDVVSVYPHYGGGDVVFGLPDGQLFTAFVTSAGEMPDAPEYHSTVTLSGDYTFGFARVDDDTFWYPTSTTSSRFLTISTATLSSPVSYEVPPGDFPTYYYSGGIWDWPANGRFLVTATYLGVAVVTLVYEYDPGTDSVVIVEQYEDPDYPAASASMGVLLGDGTAAFVERNFIYDTPDIGVVFDPFGSVQSFTVTPPTTGGAPTDIAKRARNKGFLFVTDSYVIGEGWTGPSYMTVIHPPVATGLPPIRQLQRGDGLGVGGVPRALQTSSRQASLRSGTSFI